MGGFDPHIAHPPLYTPLFVLFMLFMLRLLKVGCFFMHLDL